MTINPQKLGECYLVTSRVPCSGCPDLRAELKLLRAERDELREKLGVACRELGGEVDQLDLAVYRLREGIEKALWEKMSPEADAILRALLDGTP